MATKKITKKTKASKATRVKEIAQAAALAATLIDGKKLYKVLSAKGGSQNGGTMQWSLPADGKPGAWHEEPEAIMCSQGLHLTSEPPRWWKAGCRVFEVEAEDLQELDGVICWEGDKVVARKVRLIRELSNIELADVGIFRQGYHEVRGGRYVIAEGSSHVKAFDSSQVTAYDSSQVAAYGLSQVTAYDSSHVKAYDSSQVTAYGSSQVTACDVSLVCTRPDATYLGNRSVVTLSGDATHLEYRDQSTKRPVIRFADPASTPATEAAQ
jgi:hypothetical protein